MYNTCTRSQSLEHFVLIVGNPIAILPAAFAILLYGFLGTGTGAGAGAGSESLTPLVVGNVVQQGKASKQPMAPAPPRCCCGRRRNRSHSRCASCPAWLRPPGYQYPRWFEFLLLCLGVTAPLTYYFHQAAHTPPGGLHFTMRWLQRIGLALSPEFHKEHHRRPNGTWSVLVGWMDFIPNFLASCRLTEALAGIGLPRNALVVDSEARSSLIAIFVVVLLPWYAWLLYFERKRRHVATRTVVLCVFVYVVRRMVM